MTVMQCLLQRRKTAVLRDVLDGPDARFVHLYRVGKTGARRAVIDQHRACATDAVLATDMRARQPAIFA